MWRRSSGDTVRAWKLKLVGGSVEHAGDVELPIRFLVPKLVGREPVTVGVETHLSSVRRVGVV